MTFQNGQLSPIIWVIPEISSSVIVLFLKAYFWNKDENLKNYIVS